MSIKATITLAPKFRDTDLGQELQKIIDREFDSEAQRYKTALTRAMESVMKTAVSVWHATSGLSTGNIVASAIKVESNFIRSVRHHRTVELTAYFDNSILDTMSDCFPKAGKWASRHPELCDRSVGQYIFSLRWNMGATGLPDKAYATGSGWENPHFTKSELGPMSSYCKTQVAQELVPVSGLMKRGRNQRMGAGMLSSNRSGAGNLTHGKGGGT